MYRPNRLKSLVFPCALLLVVASGFAQGGIGTTVIGAGGVSAVNRTMRLLGTIGQPIIGTARSVDIDNLQGFWHTRTTEIASTTGTQDATYPDGPPNLRCTPNPISGTAVVQVLSSEKGHVTLSLIDQFGRDVRTLINGQIGSADQTFAFDSEGLPNGRYTLKLTSDDATFTLPILVIR